jgi:N-acetyl-gamma-glutamyl-phosphate reductase
MSVPVAVIGATGYTGGELLRLLATHPGADVVFATSRERAGASVGAVHAHLSRAYPPEKIVVSAPDPAEVAGRCAVAFLCLPHGASAATAATLRDAGMRVVDLSADFRLRNIDTYRAWYGDHHPCPARLEEAVYGLPERYRSSIRTAALVAVPGCYATSVTLGLFPALRAGLVDRDSIIADAKSGVSGAGRSPALKTHFPEVHGALSAYAVASHRHTPEMEQELSRAAGAPVSVTFTPHLVPMSRGILATLYAKLLPGAGEADVRDAYASAYAGEPFVEVLPAGEVPGTGSVAGSNLCRIGLTVEARTGRLIVVSVIDNLVKGAAGAAVQCFNLMTDQPETTGLDAPPLAP